MKNTESNSEPCWPNMSADYSRALLTVIEGDLANFRLMLENGLDPHIRDGYDVPLLHRVCVNNQPDMLELLIARGASPEVIGGKDKWAPLHCASIAGAYECVELLLSFGVDTEIVSKNKSTALHFSAISAMPELVQLLLDHGANINHKNIKGQTPRDRAVKENKHEVIYLFDMHAARNT